MNCIAMSPFLYKRTLGYVRKPKEPLHVLTDARILSYCRVDIYWATSPVMSCILTVTCAFASQLKSATSTYDANRPFEIWPDLVLSLN